MVGYANILSNFLLPAAGAYEPRTDPDAWTAFDNSLDSLIQDSVYYTRPFTLLGEDTLRGNPTEIQYVYYLRIEADSMLVPANCYNLKLRNHHVASTASETNLGERWFTRKYTSTPRSISNTSTR